MPKRKFDIEMPPRWEAQVRAGKGAAVRAELDRLSVSTIPRKAAVAAARIARRVGNPTLALKLLYPWVRAERAEADPSPDEQAEYAASLVAIGALPEARELLASVKPADVKEAALYRAYLAIAERETAEAITWLKAFLELPGVSSYWRDVARVNLAEALANEGDLLRADRLSQELLAGASLRGNKLVLFKTFEIAAQLALREGRWARAESHLASAAKLADTSDITARLLLDKWRAVAEARRLMRAHAGEASRRKLGERLVELRQRAHAAGLSEVARDSDRYLALLLRDESILHHVYFGTPYPAYRRRLALAWDPAHRFADTYVWTGSPEATAIGEPIDLSAAGLGAAGPGRGKTLRAGKLHHRLLATLASDFYAPLRAASLFHRLFPDERFHPTYSQPRVHIAVARLKRWLQSRKSEIAIIEQGGGYRARPTATSPLRLGCGQPASAAARLVEEMRRRWGTEAVSLKEVGEALELAPRSLHRLVAQAVNEGLVTREGAGAATRYRAGGDPSLRKSA